MDDDELIVWNEIVKPNTVYMMRRKLWDEEYPDMRPEHAGLSCGRWLGKKVVYASIEQWDHPADVEEGLDALHCGEPLAARWFYHNAVAHTIGQADL